MKIITPDLKFPSKGMSADDIIRIGKAHVENSIKAIQEMIHPTQTHIDVMDLLNKEIDGISIYNTTDDIINDKWLKKDK